jgi:lipopolysaccharide export system protein LptA
VVFSGDVLITQGALRLSAAKVLVSYDNVTSMIATINASDGVVLVSGAEAAEADGAEYDVLSRTVLMSGNVLLMQGNFALSAQQMRIDLEDGSAQMIGRVKTVLQPKSKS